MSISLRGVSFAHQPRLIFQQPVGEVIQVNTSEVSQAFYGNLAGQEDVYNISSDTGFLLYVNIIVPAISGSRTDFFVDIIQWNDSVYTRLNGKSFVWTDFFEPFGWDNYLKGPEREKQVPAGNYTIRVSNPWNEWKYSLAIGKIESFPFNEIIATYKNMPALKMQFFEKPRYTIFRNFVWLWMFMWIILLVVLTRWGIKIVRYIQHK